MSCRQPVNFFDNLKKTAALSDQNYQFSIAKLHRSQSFRKIVCPHTCFYKHRRRKVRYPRACKRFSGDHTKVFKVRLRRDNVDRLNGKVCITISLEGST